MAYDVQVQGRQPRAGDLDVYPQKREIATQTPASSAAEIIDRLQTIEKRLSSLYGTLAETKERAYGSEPEPELGNWPENPVSPGMFSQISTELNAVERLIDRLDHVSRELTRIV